MKKLMIKMAAGVMNRRGDSHMESVIQILIAVVLGLLLLAGLYRLFNEVVLPNLETAITDIFNYTGG